MTEPGFGLATDVDQNPYICPLQKPDGPPDPRSTRGLVSPEGLTCDSCSPSDGVVVYVCVCVWGWGVVLSL